MDSLCLQGNSFPHVRHVLSGASMSSGDVRSGSRPAPGTLHFQSPHRSSALRGQGNKQRGVHQCRPSVTMPHWKRVHGSLPGAGCAVPPPPRGRQFSKRSGREGARRPCWQQGAPATASFCWDTGDLVRQSRAWPGQRTGHPCCADSISDLTAHYPGCEHTQLCTFALK